MQINSGSCINKPGRKEKGETAVLNTQATPPLNSEATTNQSTDRTTRIVGNQSKHYAN